MDAITNPQDQLSRQWFDEVRESSLVLRISRVVCSNGSVKVASRRHYAARHSRLKLIHRVCYGSSPFFSFFFSFFLFKKSKPSRERSTDTRRRHDTYWNVRALINARWNRGEISAASWILYGYWLGYGSTTSTMQDTRPRKEFWIRSLGGLNAMENG